MRKVILISCASKKSLKKSKARDLYVSTLFKKNLRFALKLAPDQVFILSAKHGLVGLDEEIEPYDLTLNNMSAGEVRQWANGVLRQLSEKTDLQNDQFVFLAGEKYRKYLLPHMEHAEIPFQGLTIGKQLHRLGE